jgi:flagellar basal body-associated protein FliL
MKRQELEQQALDLVAGRKPAAKAAKAGMSTMAMLSIILWIAAVVVIGGIAGYVFLQK